MKPVSDLTVLHLMAPGTYQVTTLRNVNTPENSALE